MRLAIVATLLLSLAACAQAPAWRPAMTQWDYSPPMNGDGMHIALINAAGEQNALQLYCHEPTKDLVVQVAPKGIAGTAADQALTLAFDDGAPVLQHWTAQMYEGRFFDFSLGKEEAGFDAVVRDLKIHRSVELVISTAGKEVRRDRFSLDHGAEVIDRVLEICGHPIPA